MLSAKKPGNDSHEGNCKAPMREQEPRAHDKCIRAFALTVAQSQHDSDGADVDGWAGGWESRVARHAKKSARKAPAPAGARARAWAQSCGFQIRA